MVPVTKQPMMVPPRKQVTIHEHAHPAPTLLRYQRLKCLAGWLLHGDCWKLMQDYPSDAADDSR